MEPTKSCSRGNNAQVVVEDAPVLAGDDVLVAVGGPGARRLERLRGELLLERLVERTLVVAEHRRLPVARDRALDRVAQHGDELHVREQLVRCGAAITRLAGSPAARDFQATGPPM